MYKPDPPIYPQIFGHDDCPCNHCMVEPACKFSERDNHTDEEKAEREEKWKKEDEEQIEEAKLQFEADYKQYQETGILPKKYEPHYESHVAAKAETDRILGNYHDDDDPYGGCPYIEEYCAYKYIPEELEQLDKEARSYGYKNHSDLIYNHNTPPEKQELQFEEIELKM